MTNVSRADQYRVRSSSLAPSITESFEPRNPPPEYRHFTSQSLPRFSSLYNYEFYIQETDAEYAVESEEEDQPGELGLSVSTRIFDDTGQNRDGTVVVQPEDEQRPFYPIRGRRKPSTASSDIDIEVAPGSSLSSIDKSHADPASPVFGSNVKRSLQIDMKNLVGDSVANMSISPGSRDVVLAARRGMYIIDLETPLEVPRFLPQGGTWDVADVQWNPHPARAEYIASTSAERLLIWNLLLVGKSNIQHMLQAHYRAVTDINWHTTECDTVVSAGIDSWLWAWDLRDPRKPIFGLSAFKSGGTQVKWNRQDGNILASSHANNVYIWDRRKGSLPVTRIRAHTSKIYGIDWSHDRRNEIITCSLDRSIKVWDVTEPFASNLYSGRPINGSLINGIGGNEENETNIYGPIARYGPKRTINTLYPVWRAKYLPFGKGVLSLAQRGETVLEMYALNGPTESNTPVEVFEGHTDVVKEFVWRKGDHDEFQLITWSKDRTLKFWPVDTEVIHKVGYEPDLSKRKSTASRVRSISFRSPPEFGLERRRPLPAHFGSGSILTDAHFIPQLGPQLVKHSETDSDGPQRTTAKPFHIQTMRVRGHTMSRRPVSTANVDAFSWLANVKVGGHHESNSGPASQERSQSRFGSGSRLLQRDKSVPIIAHGTSQGDPGVKRRGSESKSRTAETQDTTGQALQDEITTVLTKLAPHKIKLEKHELTKKRTCTLGLHGPWGENSQLQVFIRVTFTFPRDYPYAKHPNGIPTVDVERNPLIPVHDRARMLRRLRTIRERRRPCLEACLRFLLFGDEEEEQPGPAPHLDSGSSSEEDLHSRERKKRRKEMAAISMLWNHKNLAEPRTSQGTFGPNGELVCFFRASPRIVRNVLRGLTNSSANLGAHDSTPLSPPRQLEDLPPVQPFLESEMPEMLRSPSLVSEAVAKLTEAAKDREGRSPSAGRREAAATAGGDIQRVLVNLVALSQHKARRDSEGSHQAMSTTGGGPPGGTSASGAEAGRNYALSMSKSAVFLVSANDTAGPDRKAAVGYVYACEEGLREMCEKNARNARASGRYDHERVFEILKTLFLEAKAEGKSKGGKIKDKPKFASEMVAKKVFMQLYTHFAKDKEVQMLAMLSVLVLQTYHCSPESLTLSLPIFVPAFTPSPSLMNMTPTQTRLPTRSESGSLLAGSSSMLTLPKIGPADYFSITRAINNTVGPPSSPDWPRLPAAPTTPSAFVSLPLTASASRGSWSSLFGTAGVRQFVQETFTKEGQLGFSDPVPVGEGRRPQGERKLARPVSAGARPLEDLETSLLKNQQQSQQRRGKQKRNSVHMPSQRQQQQQNTVLSGVTPLRRSSTEVTPAPLKASLSVSSVSSSGSAKRSPLSPIENVDLIGRRGQERQERKKVLVFEEEDENSTWPLFDRALVEQFKAHVNAYAEVLHRWEMDHQRLELLKAVSSNVALKRETETYSINIAKACTVCLTVTEKSVCPTCGSYVGALLCSVCRLPVKGLSRSCLLCYHVTHISCIQSIVVPICPTGCGCVCDAWYNEPESMSVMPSTGMATASVSNSGQHVVSATRPPSIAPVDPGPGLRSAQHALSLLLS